MLYYRNSWAKGWIYSQTNSTILHRGFQKNTHFHDSSRNLKKINLEIKFHRTSCSQNSSLTRLMKGTIWSKAIYLILSKHEGKDIVCSNLDFSCIPGNSNNYYQRNLSENIYKINKLLFPENNMNENFQNMFLCFFSDL